jgi:hypothetical protein
MNITAKYINHIELDNPFVYSRWNKINLYIFADANGHKYVWKTASRPIVDGVETKGIKRGNTYRFDATIKTETTYKGESETVVMRCKNFELLETPTPVVKQRITAEEQIATLKEGDTVIRMLYSRYKKHYADCETIVNSYDVLYGADGIERRVIKVIVRAGRMVASGTRGKEYSYYRFRTTDDELIDIKAVELKNAMRRAPQNSVYVGELSRDLYGAYRFHAE